MADHDPADLDPGRYQTKVFDGRGFPLAYIHEGAGRSEASGRPPLVLIHGWPETKRIWWRNIGPLADAGLEVIAPDLRGFGESGVAPDGFHDAPVSSHDIHALVHDHLGHERAVLVAGDFGGVIAQDLALRRPELVDSMVLFNAPLPIDRDLYEGLDLGPRSAHDYFFRQGTDADALAAELASPDQRRRYIATFYSSRFWAHPGQFDEASIAFHTEPFADGEKLRASFGAYTAVFDPETRSESTRIEINPNVRVLILQGASDHVIFPDFDRMAARVFADHVGPYRVRDCGHFVQWEAADVLNTTLTGFYA
jgi:pimeloyl-ACP methyl ester carboxylesterase